MRAGRVGCLTQHEELDDLQTKGHQANMDSELLFHLYCHGFSTVVPSGASLAVYTSSAPPLYMYLKLDAVI